MRTNEFLAARCKELRKFFELRFGSCWHPKITEHIGGWLCMKPARLEKAETLARLHGWLPQEERKSAPANERIFFRRLRLLLDRAGLVPAPVCHTASFWHTLDEVLGHRRHRSKHSQKHKDSYSDVIPLDLLVFEEPAQRTASPAFRALDSGPGAGIPAWKTLEDWLTPSEGKPPGCDGPQGGRDGPQFRSGADDIESYAHATARPGRARPPPRSGLLDFRLSLFRLLAASHTRTTLEKL
jgi:hypothetical protein